MNWLLYFLHVLFCVVALQDDRDELLHRAVWRLASPRLHGLPDLGPGSRPAHRTTQILRHAFPEEAGQSGQVKLDTFSVYKNDRGGGGGGEWMGCIVNVFCWLFSFIYRVKLYIFLTSESADNDVIQNGVCVHCEWNDVPELAPFVLFNEDAGSVISKLPVYSVIYLLFIRTRIN